MKKNTRKDLYKLYSDQEFWDEFYENMGET